jgi:hypothetical protein
MITHHGSSIAPNYLLADKKNNASRYNVFDALSMSVLLLCRKGY